VIFCFKIEFPDVVFPCSLPSIPRSERERNAVKARSITACLRMPQR
jgi:hypothetical protein